MQQQRSLGRSLGVLALYALIGPPLGALIVFAVVMAVSSAGSGSFDIESLASIAKTLTLFAFLLGGVPAFLTGAWLARKTFVSGTFSAFQAVAAVAVATVISGAVLALQAHTNSEPGGGVGGAVWLAMCVLPVALVCAYLCRWLAARLGLID